MELFAGIEQQQLEVQLIPRDASQCRLLISNKTDQPLSVKLPEAFAGVPVLAQFGRASAADMPPGSDAAPAANAPRRVGGSAPANGAAGPAVDGMSRRNRCAR